MHPNDYTRIQFMAGGLGDWLQTRSGGSLSIHLAAKRAIEEYRDLLRAAIPRLSMAEASLIVDALYNPSTESWIGTTLWKEIEEAIRTDRLEEKWDIRGDALVARLRDLPPFNAWAVLEAVRAFHAIRSDACTEDKLYAVGLVRSRRS